MVVAFGNGGSDGGGGGGGWLFGSGFFWEYFKPIADVRMFGMK